MVSIILACFALFSGWGYNPGTADLPYRPINEVRISGTITNTLSAEDDFQFLDTAPITSTEFARLYTASQRYLAADTAQVTEVARRLNFLPDDVHPSTMSAPLAFAILRDSGRLDQKLDLHQFWLMEQNPNWPLLEKTFPRGTYLWYNDRDPINQFDFYKFPLHPGDLLLIHAGPNGDFSQVLTVTRVDSIGRAYAVTTRQDQQGYRISEWLLYDPLRPGDGLFYEWTDRENNQLGSTGFGGFDLWRPRHILDGPPIYNLRRSLDETLLTYGGDWQVLIRESGGRVLYARQPNLRKHIASMVKLPIALLFFKSLEADTADINFEDRQELISYLSEYGIDGRSYWQLLEAMLVKSEEKATDSLLKAIELSKLDVDGLFQEWHLENTNVYLRHSTPVELTRMWDGLWHDKYISREAGQLILSWLHQYTPNDSLRLAAIEDILPGARVYNKRGTITDEFLLVADSARIIYQGQSYDVVLICRQSEVQETSYELVEEAMGEIAQILENYLKDLSPELYR